MQNFIHKHARSLKIKFTLLKVIQTTPVYLLWPRMCVSFCIYERLQVGICLHYKNGRKSMNSFIASICLTINHRSKLNRCLIQISNSCQIFTSFILSGFFTHL